MNGLLTEFDGDALAGFGGDTAAVVDGLAAPNVAVGELLESKRLRDPPDSFPACDEFDAHMEKVLSMTDKERQMAFPWADLYESDF